MKKNKTQISGYFVLIILFILLIFGLFNKQSILTIETDEDVVSVFVEIASSQEERIHGLMFRDHLEENHGMLFLYEKDAQPKMWMKNMIIPLDIIFIDSDFTITFIAQDVEPCNTEYCQIYTSKEPSAYVLEVSANFTEVSGVAVGDIISLP